MLMCAFMRIGTVGTACHDAHNCAILSSMSKRKHPKKPASQDWHRADIVAALRKAGWSIRRLSRHHGYSSPTTLCVALDRPWPKGERIIAEALDMDPARIWPSRYPRQHTTRKVA